MNYTPETAAPTLGDIAEALRRMIDRGATVESIRWALGRVADEPRPAPEISPTEPCTVTACVVTGRIARAQKGAEESVCRGGGA